MAAAETYQFSHIATRLLVSRRPVRADAGIILARVDLVHLLDLGFLATDLAGGNAGAGLDVANRFATSVSLSSGFIGP